MCIAAVFRIYMICNCRTTREFVLKRRGWRSGWIFKGVCTVPKL